jgi:eukaryotic-like serine/threonine-protein kinase
LSGRAAGLIRSGLARKIFLGNAVVVMVALGAALLVTRNRVEHAADDAATRALQSTQSAINDALEGRSHTLARLTAALVQVPAYVSRIGEAMRRDDRANLLDQADELRAQTGASWVLITDPMGVLKAWTADRNAFGEDFSRGALIGRSLEGKATQGLWLEPADSGDMLYQAAAVPVTDPGSDRPFGVVVAALTIDSALAGDLKRHTGSEILFFSRDTLGVPHLALTTLPADSRRAAVETLNRLGSQKDTLPTRFQVVGGETRYEGTTGILRTADGTPLGGYAGLHSRDADLAAYRLLSRRIWWAFGAGLLLAILTSALIAGQITRPVQHLVEVTGEVSEGRYTGKIAVETRDEIGELAEAFRGMLEELKEKDRLVEYLQARPTGPPPTAAPAVRAEGQLTPGSRLAGRYDIETVLGEGGMGIVYRAFDQEIGETVALKALRPELGRFDSTLLDRFKQELRLARRITHRNVVRTYDLGETNGIYYITMEYVRGTSLATLIREAGKLEVAVALTIGKQLCRALEAAHEEGIVHRDIKPQNLLVEPSGFLKVMDFGIARLAERPKGELGGLTAVGVVMGTPQYMAPEQILGDPVDGRTDIYACGAVLFECLVGRPVFEVPSIVSLVSKQLDEVPPDPSTLNPSVPQDLSRIVLRALARRPEDRWSTATELLRSLEKIAT